MSDDGEIKAWLAEEIAHLERELADTLALRDKGRAEEIAHLERKLAATLAQRDKGRTEKIARLERERAAAQASFSEERERAQREGERVIAAIEQRDKARNDALEEAAKVCDRLRNKNYSSEEWVAGTDDCAAAIRAMKESAP